MPHEIDNVDFSILRCVKDADRPLWKTKVDQLIGEQLHTLPLQKDVSAQTVGRHMDTLEDKGYLETTIVSPDDVNRDLIIGYKLTADGKRILDTKREILLKRIVSRELFSGDTFPIEKEALEILVRNEFTAGLAINATDGYSREQLLHMVALHFIEQGMMDTFPAEERQQLHNAIENTSSDI